MKETLLCACTAATSGAGDWLLVLTPAGEREIKMIKPAVTSVIGKLYVLGNLDLFQTVKTCEDL